ncbi:hypothetical protein DFP73DRAFT_536121 [Morchella snyderi]|nr:hypothetical protein DFP73DRAFT_536121 [Morchella snyderi]
MFFSFPAYGRGRGFCFFLVLSFGRGSAHICTTALFFIYIYSVLHFFSLSLLPFFLRSIVGVLFSLFFLLLVLALADGKEEKTGGGIYRFLLFALPPAAVGKASFFVHHQEPRLVGRPVGGGGGFVVHAVSYL